MYLKDRKTGDAVEITDLSALFDPFSERVPGRFHSGEEMQDVEQFPKAGLEFPPAL